MNIVYFPDPHNYGTHVLPRGLGSLRVWGHLIGETSCAHSLRVWGHLIGETSCAVTLTEGLGTSHW